MPFIYMISGPDNMNYIGQTRKEYAKVRYG